MLFGIFFFPITFQQVHIVWHHAHGYKGGHRDFSVELHDKGANKNTENISKKEKLCPIGEYQFSINDLPKLSFFSSKIPAIACIYNDIAALQQYKEVFSAKPPRAPPLRFN